MVAPQLLQRDGPEPGRLLEPVALQHSTLIGVFLVPQRLIIDTPGCLPALQRLITEQR